MTKKIPFNPLRWLPQALLIGIAAAARPAPALADEPCRVYVSVGEVRIFGADGVRVVRTSAEVRMGEAVESTSATTVAFFRAGARSDRLESGPSKRLSCSSSAAAGEDVSAKLARLMDHLMLQTTTLSRPAGYRGPQSDQDGAERLQVLFPANESRVLSASPRFAWNLAGASYLVTLGRMDDQVVWRRTVAGTNSLAYPEGESALAPGASYWWKVEALAPGLARTPQQASASFSIATSEQRLSIARSAEGVKGDCQRLGLRPLDCALAVAGVYTTAGYWNDAIQSLLQAQNEAPTEPSVSLVLGRMLALPPEPP